MRKKICVVTGSRAEYGLLKPLLEKIKKDKDLQLQLIITGAHLAREFGLTYREIEKDGFRIDSKINILSGCDTPVGISKSMAKAMSGFAAAYERMRPNIIVVLGDRFEIFSAVTTAHVARIPVAHIHGGELTEGAIDDAFRHSITKMSQLHFTATEEYRKRVIQLGESPGRVFNVGALGLDGLDSMPLLSRQQLEKEMGLRFDRNNLLVTFHPATLESGSSRGQFSNLLAVLDGLSSTHIIFTKSNADMGGKIINSMINKYVSRKPDKAKAFASMGRINYLSTMRFMDAVVGNSSSGLTEAPSFRIGTINIGDRQSGRIKAKSVIDCDHSRDGIAKAIRRLYSAEFQDSLRRVVNPYEKRGTAFRILKVLKRFGFENGIKKSFYDISFRVKDRCRK